MLAPLVPLDLREIEVVHTEVPQDQLERRETEDTLVHPE